MVIARGRRGLDDEDDPRSMRSTSACSVRSLSSSDDIEYCISSCCCCLSGDVFSIGVSAAAFTFSGGAHTPDSTTSDDRMQVPLSTRCTRPTALRTPAATAPSLCDGSKLTSRPAACALAAARR